MSPTSGPQAPHWVDHGQDVLRWWIEGLSAGTISKRLAKEKHVTVSRGAVIGFVTRHGHNAKTRHQPSIPVTRFKAPKVVRQLGSDTASARNIGRATRSDGSPVSTTPPQPIVERKVEGAPPPLKISMADLGAHMCKWPIGDPAKEGFGFCGHPTAAGSQFPMYCAPHAAAALSKAAKKDLSRLDPDRWNKRRAA